MRRLVRRGRSDGAGATSEPDIVGYRDFRLIGSGGFSKVYTAYQERFARTVAVKVITVDLSDDALRRFRREQVTTGQLDGHPHIIRVYESGSTEAGQPYLTMEFHEQGSLADRVRRRGPLPLEEVLNAGVKLACALEAAHQRGIVHRDVKPQNVLLSPFVGPVLADFGIAAFDDARLHVTTGEAFSVLHVAPEVLDGHPATVASDLYALASTLYELLAGHAPFADTGDAGLLGLMRRVRTDPVPPIERDDLPDAVVTELTRLMAREPGDRPATALAMAERLRALEGAVGYAETALVGCPLAGRAEAGAAAALADPDADTPEDPKFGEMTPKTGANSPSFEGLGSPNTITHLPLGRPPEAPPTGDGARRSWRRPAVLVGATALAAGVLAGGAWWLVGDDGGRADPDERTEGPRPSARKDLPPCPASSGESVSDRSFAAGEPPTSLSVEVSGDGTAATVRWDDPNPGPNVYVVYANCAAAGGGDRAAVRAIAPGEPTVATVEGLSLDFNYCFTVGVLKPSGSATPYVGPDGNSFVCLDQKTR